MMPDKFDTVIRISSERGEIMVEQRRKDGVTACKSISPESLCTCVLNSRYDDERHATGLLPEGCIAAVMEKQTVCYYIRCPELYADISYYGTEYPHFPIPRLVFGFRYMPREGKVSGCRVCVVKDERLTPDTPT